MGELSFINNNYVGCSIYSYTDRITNKNLYLLSHESYLDIVNTLDSNITSLDETQSPIDRMSQLPDPTDPNNGYVGAIISSNPLIYFDRYFELGKLISKIIIDSNNLVKSASYYSYIRNNLSNQTVNNKNIYRYKIWSNEYYPLAPYYGIGYKDIGSVNLFYNNLSYKYLLASKINIEYTKSGVLETLEKYKYDKYNVRKYIKIVKSNGDTSLTVYKHPQDFASNIPQTSEILSLNYLLDKECFAFPVEQIAMSIHNNDTTIVNGKLFTYTNNGININRHRYYELNNSIPQSTLVKTALYPNKNLYKLLETYSYDLINNSLKQVKYSGNKSDLYYWCNKGMNPFLIIKNIDTTKVNLINKYSDFNNLYNSVLKNYEVDYYHNKIINDSDFKDCQIESYYFEPSVGLAQSSDSKGVKRYYQYDNFGRLMCVRDNNRNVLERYAYHYQNGSAPESLQIPENNIGAKLTCTLCGNGTLGNNNSLLRVGDAINLGAIFPVTPSQYYEFDGYYVNGVLIPNPGNYIVQGDVHIEARTKAMISPKLTIRFLDPTGSRARRSLICKYETNNIWHEGPLLSYLSSSKTISINASDFPIKLSFQTVNEFPSLRITHNGISIYENMWSLPSGFVFECKLNNVGPHEIVIEIP